MSDIRFVAKQYIDANWAVVPIDPGSKGLEEKGWLKKAAGRGYQVEDFKAASNIGVVPGPPSGDRVNWDLDSPMAIRVAAKLMPSTGLIHGRPGKPTSHLWYLVPGASPRKFVDPVTKNMLLEMQVANGQTVVPPSIHPSGEHYEWENQGEPTQLSMEMNATCGKYTAVATLLATYWPKTSGSRHDLALCTTGFLAQHIKKTDALVKIMEVIFEEAGDEDIKDRMTAVRTTIASLSAETKPTSGEPTFREKFPHGDVIADALLDYFEVKRGKGRGKKRGPEPTGIFDHQDFVAFLPRHVYLLLADGMEWAHAAIAHHVKTPKEDPQGHAIKDDLTIGEWLDRFRHVEQVTWAPGMEQFLKDTLVIDSGSIPKEGMTTLNLYRPPHPYADGNPEDVGPWLDHLQRIYPEDWEWILCWLAWRVQHPEVKINHGLVLGGAQGIGKDTIFYPVKDAVGAWNWNEVGPDILMGRFNGHLKSVVLRVNEARDMGEMNRYQLYERCKALLASPPEYFRVDEKNMREHPVCNIVGVIFTTNHKETGLYLPDDDRRHYVAWSESVKTDFVEPDEDPIHPRYFKQIYDWYHNGGKANVIAFLRQPSLLALFDPKAPPRRTEAWHQIVSANRSPEEAEIAGILESLDAPIALIVDDLIACCLDGSDQSLVSLGEWLKDRRNARVVPNRLESLGYVSVRNSQDARGYWKINGKKEKIYVRQDLTVDDRLSAARDRQRGVVKKGDEGHQGAHLHSAPKKFPF